MRSGSRSTAISQHADFCGATGVSIKKKSLGVEFGEYSLRQYRYAKEYYRIVKEELSQIKGAKNHE